MLLSESNTSRVRISIVHFATGFREIPSGVACCCPRATPAESELLLSVSRLVSERLQRVVHAVVREQHRPSHNCYCPFRNWFQRDSIGCCMLLPGSNTDRVRIVIVRFSTGFKETPPGFACSALCCPGASTVTESALNYYCPFLFFWGGRGRGATATSFSLFSERATYAELSYSRAGIPCSHRVCWLHA